MRPAKVISQLICIGQDGNGLKALAINPTGQSDGLAQPLTEPTPVNGWWTDRTSEPAKIYLVALLCLGRLAQGAIVGSAVIGCRWDFTTGWAKQTMDSCLCWPELDRQITAPKRGPRDDWNHSYYSTLWVARWFTIAALPTSPAITVIMACVGFTPVTRTGLCHSAQWLPMGV